MQGKKNYQEKMFTSFQLSSRVPEDNIYRRLKDVLDLQWLYKATSKYYGTEGQQSIDPVVFFKLILIGYLENLPSDRRIISTVSMRLDMLYFIGYDIDEDLPWHSTLSRTRQLYSEDVFKELFRKVLKQCIEEGMVAGRRQVIDSVLVKANASLDSLVEREILQDGEAYAESLKLVDEDGKPVPRSKKALSKNDMFTSKTDPDARMRAKPGKPTQLNYLAQVSVDAAGYVITNIEAHHADKGDSECLPQVVQNARVNLQSEGLIVEQVLADTGYSSGRALKYLEVNKLLGYIPNIAGYKAEREGFSYDAVKDEFTCSEGRRLPFRQMDNGLGGRKKRVYSSLSKECSGCSLQSQCIGTGKKKKITITEDKPLLDKMHLRMKSPKGTQMMKLRKKTVEPVLGTLVNFLGMKKVNTRGIRGANKCIIMAGLAYNLKKLLNHKGPNVKVAIKRLEKTLQNGLIMFFQLLYVPGWCDRSYTTMNLKVIQ
jgi:transposase